MVAAAGKYSGELPEPVTRPEFYWQKIAQRIDAGGSVSPESIDVAIEAYLNSHDADIVTEQELSDALAGKVDKETGKSLMTADEHTKLGGVTIGTMQEFIDYIGVKR